LINPSPSILLLEEYGGPLDSKEYQKYILQNKSIGDLKQSILQL
jgi:hypothetical protein